MKSKLNITLWLVFVLISSSSCIKEDQTTYDANSPNIKSVSGNINVNYNQKNKKSFSDIIFDYSEKRSRLSYERINRINIPLTSLIVKSYISLDKIEKHNLRYNQCIVDVYQSGFSKKNYEIFNKISDTSGIIYSWIHEYLSKKTDEMLYSKSYKNFLDFESRKLELLFNEPYFNDNKKNLELSKFRSNLNLTEEEKTSLFDEYLSLIKNGDMYSCSMLSQKNIFEDIMKSLIEKEILTYLGKKEVVNINFEENDMHAQFLHNGNLIKLNQNLKSRYTRSSFYEGMIGDVYFDKNNTKYYVYPTKRIWDFLATEGFLY